MSATIPEPVTSAAEYIRRAESHDWQTGISGPITAALCLLASIATSLIERTVPPEVEQRIRADERERCAKVADADSVRLFDSRRKAVAAGREGVASHRQSDIETATRVAAAIRALGDAPGEA